MLRSIVARPVTVVALTQPSADSQPSQPLLPDIAVSALVAPATPQLEVALDRAFAEPEAPPFRRTKAVLVLRDGHLIAERYAKGYGVDTPMLGFSSDELTEAQQAGMVRREARSVSPYGNAMLDPDDIAQVALFLVSDAARALHGSYVLADQGISSAMLPPAS